MSNKGYMNMIKTKILVTYDIEEAMQLWPDINKLQVHSAIITAINTNRSPVAIFDRKLLAGHLLKVEEPLLNPGRLVVKANFIYRNNLKYFDLHFVITAVEDNDICINPGFVYGTKE